ncbi:MAG: tetratricopeptide repeat protein [Myxococcales bacterium]|nr:tetratricopeptide repeat protein [Myxococcales bacterium]
MSRFRPWRWTLASLRGARGVLAAGALVGCLSEPPAASGDETVASRFAAAWRRGDCEAVLANASDFVAVTDAALDTATVWAGSCLRRLDRPLDALLAVAALADAAPPRHATPRALLERGRTLYAIGDFGGAHRELTRITDDFSRHSLRDDALYYDGKALRRAGDLDGAESRFESALADPGSTTLRRAGAYYQLGLIASARGLAADAAAWFEQAILEDPTSALAFRARVRIATLPAVSGDCAGAESALTDLLSDEDDPASANRLRLEHADLIRRCGEPDRAAPLYEALWAASDDAGGVADDAGYALGRIAFGRARDADFADEPQDDVLYGEARALFELLLARFPDTAKASGARLHLGRIFIELRAYGAANVQLALVLGDRASGSWESALYHVSWAQYVKGDVVSLSAAVFGFDEVMALPGPSRFADDAAYYRARALMRTGRNDAAMAGFVALEADFPQSPFIDNAMFRMVVLSVSAGECSSASGARDRLRLEHPTSPYLADADAHVAACVSP